VALSRRASGAVLLTRASPEQARAVLDTIPGSEYDQRSRLVVVKAANDAVDATVAVVAAGTSDLPVAEEAARSLAAAGVRVARITDVGVAGVHRVLAHREELEAADCVVVVAGMEGALPSVMAGLTATPIVAVPTSVGYGASFEGLSALLAMLSSCAPGVAVVNIDNGFGAAQVAYRIVRRARRATGAGGDIA
jgi:pyridinium-3,5-biscarboxylic acid mononucleotide synthase